MMRRGLKSGKMNMRYTVIVGWITRESWHVSNPAPSLKRYAKPMTYKIRKVPMLKTLAPELILRDSADLRSSVVCTLPQGSELFLTGEMPVMIQSHGKTRVCRAQVMWIPSGVLLTSGLRSADVAVLLDDSWSSPQPMTPLTVVSPGPATSLSGAAASSGQSSAAELQSPSLLVSVPNASSSPATTVPASVFLALQAVAAQDDQQVWWVQLAPEQEHFLCVAYTAACQLAVQECNHVLEGSRTNSTFKNQEGKRFEVMYVDDSASPLDGTRAYGVGHNSKESTRAAKAALAISVALRVGPLKSLSEALRPLAERAEELRARCLPSDADASRDRRGLPQVVNSQDWTERCARILSDGTWIEMRSAEDCGDHPHCTACNKWATQEHVHSKGHKSRVQLRGRL